jgi:hypothetical protein
MPMPRAYNVVDADGHILEPLDLWDRYMASNFRDRAPRIVKGENRKERLVTPLQTASMLRQQKANQRFLSLKIRHYGVRRQQD